MPVHDGRRGISQSGLPPGKCLKFSRAVPCCGSTLLVPVICTDVTATVVATKAFVLGDSASSRAIATLKGLHMNACTMP